MRAVVTGGVLLGLAVPAGVRADEAATAAVRAHVHAGVNIRTDLGTHHTRVPIGYRWCVWDVSAVVDPMVVLDGQHDLDVLVERFVGPRLGVLAGHRWSAVAVDGGTHHQQRSLVGVTAVGPSFWDEALRTKVSLELATLWVSHGGGAEASWVSADRNLIDRIALGLFVRIEYAKGL